MARKEWAPAITEKAFMQTVIDLARLLGWKVYHTYDSRRSTSEGFPDWLLCHPRARQLIFAEVNTDTGRLTPAQRQWLDALGECNTIEATLWRPSDWERIETRLKRHLT